MIVRIALLGLLDTLRFMLFSFVFPILLVEGLVLTILVPLPVFTRLGISVLYLLLFFFLLILTESIWKRWKAQTTN